MFSGRPRFLDTKINFQEWRHLLAEELELDPISINIVGSAQLGYSLNPNKNFKLFSFGLDNPLEQSSDFDVAIIDQQLFDLSWKELQEKIESLSIIGKKPYYRKLVFEECIALDSLLPHFSYGQKWSVARDKFVDYLGDDFLNIQLGFRLYRNHHSLRKYQIKSVEAAINSIEYINFKDNFCSNLK